MSSSQASFRLSGSSARGNAFTQSALRFVVEQTVVTFDQLECFLGVDRDEALSLVREMEERRWVARKEFLEDGVEWIWPRQGGVVESGSGLPYWRWKGQVAALHRRRTFTELRLQAEEEFGGEWTSDRVLLARDGRSSRPPAGVIEVAGETRAIVVLHNFHIREFEEKLGAYSDRYDVVECFCGDAEGSRGIELIKSRTGNAKLIVRELPEDLVIRRRASRASRVERPRADASQRAILQLIAEQAVVTLDQLVRLSGVDAGRVQSLVVEMARKRWVDRGELLGDGVEWIRLRKAGVVASRSRIPHWVWPGTAASLDARYADTEVRLLLEKEAGGKWLGLRALRATHNGSLRPLAGIMEVAGETRAIAVFHSKGGKQFEKRIDRYSDRHDVVECFCSQAAKPAVELIKQRSGNSKLIIRDLPQGLGVRRKACRRKKPQADATQRSMLRLISEQGCLREDQLGRFFGLEGRKLAGVVDDFQRARWVRRVEVLSDQPPWLWLREAGVEQSGTGFEYLKPRLWRLGHKYAINEVRLEFAREAPHGRWICERQLRRELWGSWRWSAHLPDAVFEVDGERHAIEVELTPKTRRDLREVLARHSERYDAVLYFCSKPARRVLEDVQRSLRDPKLLIRDAYRLPTKAAQPPPPKRLLPLPEDIGTLALLAEQGGIPLDQLTRFLDCAEADAKELMQGLVERGFARSTSFLEEEPAWFWLRAGGARHSGTGLKALEPRVGALEKLRAANEARLLLAAPGSQRRWVSRRMMQANVSIWRGMPKAAVVDGSERYAVEIILGMLTREWHGERLRGWSQQYDGVVCLCRGWHHAEQLAKECSWPNVFVRELPGIPFAA